MWKCISLAALAIVMCGADAPLPISAHNCYPINREDNARLVEALGLGIDNIEIDIGWDENLQQILVGHDAAPQPGIRYPRFDAYFTAAIEAHWKSARADGAPTVLTIDWKTDRIEAVAAFKRYLDEHAEWFSTAIKPEDPATRTPLTPRRLTVCFTGSENAKVRYDAMVRPGEPYRAFRDVVFGAGSAYESDVKTYVKSKANAYHRFLTFYWGVVERGGPALAKDWTAADEARLKTLVEFAHRGGYRIRMYCLNGHSGMLLTGYRFANDEAARARWTAAVRAGVDWVASDEYREIVEAVRTAQ